MAHEQLQKNINNRAFPTPVAHSQNPVVLIVEDNELNRNILNRQVRRLGFDTEVAEDGVSALKLLKSQPKKFAAVLMDYALPRMDGLTTTITIRTTISKDIPIIGVSADTIKGIREKCLSAGMNDYLVKPVSMEQLTAALSKVSVLNS